VVDNIRKQLAPSSRAYGNQKLTQLADSN